MIKKSLLLFLLFFQSTSIIAQKDTIPSKLESLKINNIRNFDKRIDGCEKFKNGIFYTTLINNFRIDIIRADSIQIEKANGIEIKYRIEWLSECKYQLSYIDKNGKINDPNPVIANIYEINDNIYKYIATIKDLKIYDEGEVIKIE